MKKKFLTIFTLFTILYSVNVSADTLYVHNQPTKDTSKKIELSVDADDVIIDDKDIEFAWIFKDSEGIETPIQTENSVLDDKNGYYWAKGDENGKSTLVISYTQFGNGTYLVIARDTLHNMSEPKSIDINGWDITAPTATGITIDKTGLMKESIVSLDGASDNIALADKPYILSEITGWNGTGNTYTKKNSKEAVTGNEFTITKNGDYCITLTDYAGNIKDFPFRIDNIDRAIPVISSIEYSNNSGAINVTVNASDNSSEEPLSNYSHSLKYLIADTPEDIEKAAISSWSSSNVLNNKLGGNLATSGVASYYVGVIDEAGNYAIVPFTINADLVLGKLGTMTKDNLTSYITLTPSGRWTNGDVVCRVDIPSGTFADDVEYKFNSNAYQISNKKTFTGNGTVTVTVKDKYGNEYVSNTLTIDNIDKTKPTITVTPNSSENKATIEVSDADSKVSKVTIKGTGYLQETTIQDYQTSVASNSFVYDIHSKGSYTFTAYDEAGNKTEKILEVSGSITDNEDLINGLVKNRMTHVPSGWTNTDVELRVALTSEESLDPLPFSWDGGAYNTSKAITVTENGTHTLTVKDMYGNTYASGDYVIGNIDKTKPTISVAFTSEDKNTFKITCLDELSGLLKVTMSGEDNVEHTIKDFLTSAPTTEQVFTNKVPKNGNYTFTAYDLAGNTETFDISVDNAQITNALLDSDSIVSYVTHTPTNWTNGDVTLRLNMPSLEGLAAEPYKWNTSSYKATSDVVVTCNGDYYVTVKDEYGYEHQSSNYTVSNIDKIAPTVNSSVNANGNVITLDIIDEDSAIYGASGLSLVTVTSVKNPTEVTVKDYLVSVTEDTVDYVLSVDDTYTFHIYDRAGNVTEEVVTVTGGKVDNAELTPSELKAKLSHTPTKWTNEDVSLRLSLISEEGLAEMPYKWAPDGEFSNSRTAIVHENGNYKVWVKDTFDNVIESEPYTIGNIDKIKPTISTALDNEENTVTITVGDDLSGISKVTVADMSGKETTIKDYYATEPLTDTFDWEVPYKATFTFKVYDNAGNWDYVQNIIINSITDNEELINGNIKNRMTHTPTGWTNTDVELRIALASEEYLSENPFKWDSNAYSKDKTITVTENGTHTLTVKDMYGNEYASGAYVIGNIDKVAPTISVAFTSEDKNTFKITCLDELSGLLKVTMTGEDGIEYTIKDFLTSAPTTEQIFTNKVPKNGEYTFKAYDLAGNTETVAVTVDNAQVTNALLDKDSIKGYITHQPTEWTNGDITLRLNMPSLEGLAAEPYKWNTSSYKATSDVVVTCNGDYYVTVKDEYGYEHQSSNYTVSNIDKIAPTVSHRVNENNNVITLDIRDEDSNVYGKSGISRVTVTSLKNTTEITVKDYLVALTEDSIEYSLSVDDTYTFHVYDRAGNVTDYEVVITGGKVDNTELTPSELKAKLSHTPTKWINEDATIRLSLVSEEGLAEMPYKWAPDGEFSNSRTAIVHENGNYKVWVKDTFGNVIESDAYTIGNIDKVAPTIETALDERNNTVTITVADELSGISKVTVSDMSGTEHTIKDYYATEPKSDTFDWEVPYKANFTFKVYDNAGNWNYVQRNIIDSITDNEDLTDTGIASHLTHTPTEWTNKPVTLQINLPSFENLNPIAPFKWDDNAYSDSKTYVVNEIGSYVLTIKDKYGNEISSLPHEVANIDHINPTLAVAFNDEQNTATITVEEIADSNGASSGLDKITVTTEGAETTIKTYLTDTKSDIYNYTIPKNGKYIFKVYDRAGNVVTSEEYEILNARTGSDVLTTTGIRAAITQNPYADVYTNDSVTLTLILNGETGLAEVPYRWNGGDFTNVPSYTVTENGVYPIDVMDKYGNIIRSSYEVRNIDKNSPSITVKSVDKGRFIEITANDEILGSALGKVVIEGGELTESKVVKDYTDTIYTDTFRIETPSKGSFNLTVYDKAGNSSSAGIEIEDIITDNSELTVENITASIQSMQTEWTNSVVPLKLVLRNLDNLADEPYNWSDGVSETGFSTDNTYNVDKNGLYFVTVKDKYGNTFTSEGYEVDNIDHVVPEISYSLNDAQTVMTLNVSDVGSGVSKIAWQGDAFTGLVSIKEYLQPVEYEQGIEVAIPTNGNYVVTVYDAAGNTSTVDVKITDIKSQNPLLTPLGIYGSMKTYPSTWTNGDVVVTAELLNKENVLTDGYYWESDCDIGVDSIANEWTTHTSFTATSNGFITLSVKDEFGTPESVHVSLPYAIENIDKTLPTISMQLLEDGTVDINVADEMSDKYGASGIKEISVVDPNGTMTILKRNSVGILQDTVNYAMFLQGQYTFRVEDHAGNIAEDYLVVNNDGVATSNTWLAQGPDALTNCLNFTPTGYTKGSVMVTLAPTDTTNFATKPYKFGDDEWQSENYSVYTENCSFTVKVRDVNGVIYESGLIEINNIDNIAPNIASLTADNITDNMAQITISANDACSGVSMINIIGDEIPNETIIQKYDPGIQSVNCSYNVKKNGIYRIRVYDVTGNVTEGVVTVSGIIDVKNQSMNNTVNNTVNSTQSSNYSVTKPRTTTTNIPSKAVSRTVAAPAAKTTGTTQNNFFSAITDKISNVKEESKQVDVVPNIKVENTAENKVETTEEAMEEAKVEKANTVKVSPVVTTSTTTKLVQTSSDSPEDIVVMHRDSQSAQEVVSDTGNKKGVNIILGLLVGLVAFSAIVFGIRYYYIRKSS